MSDLLDLPPIEAAALALPEPAAPQTLAELATQPLALMEPDLLALAARYRNVAFDLKTPKGLAAMKAARHDLRENGRFAVQRATAEFKTQANAAKRAVDELADRLVGIVRPQEDDFTVAIDAREAEIEAEKAEARRLEAERVATLTAKVATIRGYVQRAAGASAERIAAGIKAIEAWTFPPEQWQEFAGQAEAARTETLEALRRMHAAAVQAEADKAERERLEAEAQVLREQAAKMEAERRAERDAEAARIAAERAAEETKRAKRLMEVTASAADMAQRISGVPTVTTPDGTVADASTGEILSTPEPALYRPLQDVPVAETGSVAGFGQSSIDTPEYRAEQEALNARARAMLAAAADAPAVKLGDLCARLGFTMTEAFVRDTLKIQPAESKGRAVLIPEASLPDLADKLVERIREVLGS